MGFYFSLTPWAPDSSNSSETAKPPKLLELALLARDQNFARHPVLVNQAAFTIYELIVGRIYLRNCHTPREAWQPSIVRELIQLQGDLELQKVVLHFVLRWKLFSIRLSFCIGWAANISTLALVFHWLAHFVWKSIGTRLFISLKHFTSLLPNPDSFYPISPIFDFDFFPRNIGIFQPFAISWSLLLPLKSTVDRSVGLGRDHAASWTCWNLVTRGTGDLPFPKWISAWEIVKIESFNQEECRTEKGGN